MNRTSKVISLRLAAVACLFFSCGFARADTFYVSNYGDNTISKIDSSGNMAVFASTGLNHPEGLALDNSGNLYVANSGTIEKFDSSGNETPFVSIPGPNFGMAFGSNGNLYVAAYQYNDVVQFTPGGQVVYPIMTVGAPTGLAFDNDGNLYVADSLNNRIMKFDSSGQSSIFANSELNRPMGLAFDSSDNLYVANSGNDTIEKFDSSGNATRFFSTYSSPSGLAFDSSGNLYAAEPNDFGMEKIDPSGHGNFWPENPSNGPTWIAVQVPEPATWSLLALGIAALLGICRLRQRSP